MAEVINSSFIPKREFKEDNGRPKKRFQLNVFFLISLVIFLSMIVGLVGVNLWKADLESGNRKLKENFTKNKENYGISTIRQFSDLDKRIKTGRELLMMHYNLSPVFTFLERNTQTNVIIQELDLEEGSSVIYAKGKGLAPDLDDLYLQSKSYAENQNVKDLILSGITRDKDGLIAFNLEFQVDKKDLTDREFINK